MSLNRQNFLFVVGASAGAYALGNWRSPGLISTAWASETESPTATFKVPPLPYAYNALEPHIGAEKMRFHHDKHHATYVKNLNAALDKHPALKGKSAEQLLRDINSIPEDIRTTVVVM